MSRKWLGGVVVGIRLEGGPLALLEAAWRERDLSLGEGG